VRDRIAASAPFLSATGRRVSCESETVISLMSGDVAEGISVDGERPRVSDCGGETVACALLLLLCTAGADDVVVSA